MERRHVVPARAGPAGGDGRARACRAGGMAGAVERVRHCQRRGGQPRDRTDAVRTRRRQLPGLGFLLPCPQRYAAGPGPAERRRRRAGADIAGAVARPAIRIDNSGVDRTRALQCLTAAIYFGRAAARPGPARGGAGGAQPGRPSQLSQYRVRRGLPGIGAAHRLPVQLHL